jgi:hypothetical protein
VAQSQSKQRHGPRARRTEVATAFQLVGGIAYDYADAFEIGLSEGETRSPEQLFRDAIANTSWVRRWVPVVHHHLLRFRLGPHSSADHILGWRIAGSDVEAIRLEAAGPLIRGTIVGQRTSQSSVIFTTFVSYASRTPARIVWAVVGPLHRRVAPYLMERGVAAA